MQQQHVSLTEHQQKKTFKRLDVASPKKITFLKRIQITPMSPKSPLLTKINKVIFLSPQPKRNITNFSLFPEWKPIESKINMKPLEEKVDILKENNQKITKNVEKVLLSNRSLKQKNQSLQEKLRLAISQIQETKGQLSTRQSELSDISSVEMTQDLQIIKNQLEISTQKQRLTSFDNIKLAIENKKQQKFIQKLQQTQEQKEQQLRQKIALLIESQNFLHSDIQSQIQNIDKKIQGLQK